MTNSEAVELTNTRTIKTQRKITNIASRMLPATHRNLDKLVYKVKLRSSSLVQSLLSGKASSVTPSFVTTLMITASPV